MDFRWLLAAALALCASCGPKVCTEMCQPLTMSVVLPHGGTEFPVTDGALEPWEHGFQGGTMIVPQVVLDAAQVAEGENVDVTIAHDPDPAAPDAFGEVAGFRRFHHAEAARVDEMGRLIVGPFTDQLGWDALDGVRMVITVDVATTTRRASLTAAITLGAPVPPSCAGFAEMTYGPDCRYRVIPGTATVNTDQDAVTIGGACDGRTGRFVLMGFVADDASNGAACALGIGAGSFDAIGLSFMDSDIISSSCQSTHMLGLGQTRHTNLWARSAGTSYLCPSLMWKDVDDELATCTCPP